MAFADAQTLMVFIAKNFLPHDCKSPTTLTPQPKQAMESTPLMQQNTSAHHLYQGTNKNYSVFSHIEKTNANYTPPGDKGLMHLSCQERDLTVCPGLKHLKAKKEKRGSYNRRYLPRRGRQGAEEHLEAHMARKRGH